jgi:hypothetical protein
LEESRAVAASFPVSLIAEFQEKHDPANFRENLHPLKTNPRARGCFSRVRPLERISVANP